VAKSFLQKNAFFFSVKQGKVGMELAINRRRKVLVLRYLEQRGGRCRKVLVLRYLEKRFLARIMPSAMPIGKKR
jgi:hypothetical protein